MDEALAAMVAALYPPLAGRVIFYDDAPPEITERQPVYAITRASSRELGYVQTGLPTGRNALVWTLTLHGLRQPAQRMLLELPGALSAHYRYLPPDGEGTAPTLVLGAFVASVEQPERAERPAAVAEATITFASEIVPG